MSLKLDQLLEGKTEEEVVKYLYDLYQGGASTTQIGEALDVTDVTIRKYFNKYNLKLKRHGGQYKGKQITITEEEYKKYPASELKKMKGCSQFTYYQLTKNYPSRVGRNKINVKKEGE